MNTNRNEFDGQTNNFTIKPLLNQHKFKTYRKRHLKCFFVLNLAFQITLKPYYLPYVLSKRSHRRGLIKHNIVTPGGQLLKLYFLR